MTDIQAEAKPLIVGIGGTARPQSSGALALQYCLRVAGRSGARTTLITAQDLQLPLYDPASSALDPHAQRIITLVHSADALVIASPAYHAGISGLVKNALDYLEELRSADPPYLDGKTVACITTSRGSQGGALALASLRSVVHALRGAPTPLGVVIDTSTPSFGPDDEPLQESTRRQLKTITAQTISAAERRKADQNTQTVVAGESVAASANGPTQS